MNALKLFQLEKPLFDELALKSRYKTLLSKMHPDRFNTELEKDAAHRLSAALSESFEQLIDFPCQAELFYMKKFNCKPNSSPDNNFLQQMWSYNEQLDDGVLDFKIIKDKTQGILVAISKYFDESNQELYDQALYELRFYQQLMERQ